ncbi:DUF4190 domain-containing protein [Salipaludibacillus sp. CUR1]|uniref:DUF4190 domain-containing protein n=1 Tax=Salipaludibacillus sp. CUR1 TaxID=2820003 RepID=UPI001E463BE0|nr:DUF4190 domain-containing protein [Salipaludibacillus sp. CUR1]MCE7794454.1 DUF4190 domain-containing protein [Salipaludibacillus sp. CUR1]
MKEYKNLKAVTSMVTGVLSIILFLLPLVGLVLAVSGVGLGILGLKEIKQTGEPGRGFAITGIICGGIGLLIPAILGVLAFYMLAG